MPVIHPIISAADRYSIVLNIMIQEPLGLRKVRLIDRFGIDILSREFACEPSVLLATEAILRERCPFQVEVTDCNEGVSLSIPYFSPEPGVAHGMPCSPLMCEERADCRDRQNTLIRQRNLLLNMCARLAQYNAKIRELITLMAIFYVLAAVFAVVAAAIAGIPYFGIVLAPAFAILAAMALAMALFFNYHLNRVRNFRDTQLREMDEARIRFMDIVDEILANCCTECITVDLTLPSCSR